MRRHITGFILITVCLAYFACHGAESGRPSGEVLVISITNDLPTIQVSTNDYYRDKPSRGLDKKTPWVDLAKPKDWRKSYSQFSDALVKAAKEAGLDADSLDKLLKKTLKAEENKGLAVSPVAVYQTQDKGEPMWIITLRWEVEKDVLEGSSMAHMRFFWFNRKSLKQLDFSTCG